MQLVSLDLEGVLVPEIWIAVAERAGIPELRRTTREEPDYGALMRFRLDLLKRHRLGLADIQATVGAMAPLPGARDFLDALRERYPVIVLSDTFYEFARPLMHRLGLPVLFCNSLETDAAGTITGWRLRLPDHKREAVRRFKQLAFRVVAAGDSYNDTGMLETADAGILFRAPPAVRAAFPQFPAVEDYPALRAAIEAAGEG